MLGRAVCQSTGAVWPSSPRSSGTVARSAASRTVRASQPLEQARPRLTGCSVVGVRFTAWPSRRCMVRPQPVEQKPQTIPVVACGVLLGGNLSQAEAARCRRSSRVKRPSRARTRERARSSSEGLPSAIVTACSPPGILGLTTAVKNRYRSTISPPIDAASPSTAAPAATSGFASAARDHGNHRQDDASHDPEDAP